jgi:hypothetical protein
MSSPRATSPAKGHPETNYADLEKQHEATSHAVPTDPHSTYDGDADKASSENELQPESPPQMKNPMMDPSSFPDGGLQAWLTVGGAWCALFVSFGRPL